jgi:AraC-like DNA-binding protein
MTVPEPARMRRAQTGGRSSASSRDAMPRRPRTFTHAHRQRLARAVAHYLQDCYRSATAARVSEFAASLDLTAPYLSRIAPDILGIPLRDFLRQEQIAYAVQLLKTTPLRSKEIALRCGFGTVSTFHRWFRSAYDTTPGAFREVMKYDAGLLRFLEVDFTWMVRDGILPDSFETWQAFNQGYRGWDARLTPALAQLLADFALLN